MSADVDEQTSAPASLELVAAVDRLAEVVTRLCERVERDYELPAPQ